MHSIALLLVMVYASVSRLWFLNQIPPLLDTASYYPRLVSAIFGIATVAVIYFLSKLIYKNKRLALLTAWVFAVSPWSVEQGRVISQPTVALFCLLLISFLFLTVKNKIISRGLLIITPLVLYLTYPQFWLFRFTQPLPKIADFLNNLFYLISPEFLFFKNTTFWWGGVRESGIFYLFFLPFLLLGIYKFYKVTALGPAIYFLIILLLSAASPYFPESREFYLAYPLLCLIVAIGINYWWSVKSKISRLIFVFLFLFIIYDIASFFHYYTVHYPQQIQISRGQINEKF
ncbi:hypothetical protein MUP32_06480 [Candidatus Microgenomates bacterium]|nr:hypothetical protein [Candidatus Microgenomates bacterium]